MQESSPIPGEPGGMILVYPGLDSDIPTICVICGFKTSTGGGAALRNLWMNQVA